MQVPQTASSLGVAPSYLMASGQDSRPRFVRMDTSSRLEASFGGTQEDIFQSLANGETHLISKTDFLKALVSTGLLPDDPRLKESMQLLASAPEMMDFTYFKRCISPNILLIDRAFQGDLAIPNFQAFCATLRDMFDRVKLNKTGKVADYIPQLSRVNPNYFAVSVCTVDGQRFSMGDASIEFCLQSTCMPINYILALEEHGEDKVHEHVGREPSGRGYNSLTLNETGHPHNPLINAGAIMICSLMQPHLELSDRFDHVIRMYRRMAGGKRVGFSNSTYLSERQTADRNFALGHYMKEKNVFPRNTNLLETLEFYFQLCSVEMNAESLSILAGTLANGGVCPTTGESVVSSDAVKNALSVMYSCGLYDYSGEFAFQIGLPAKSGVSGAMMVVIPGAMGIAIWSPPLDRFGNSVRGVEFCQRLISQYNFHNYDNLVHVSTLGKVDPRNSREKARDNDLVTLLFAASAGDLPTVRRLFLSGVNLNETDYDGRSAIHLAASEGHLRVVDFLIGCEVVDINVTDRWGGTPLDDAIREGHTEVVDLLKKHNAAVNLQRRGAGGLAH